MSDVVDSLAEQDGKENPCGPNGENCWSDFWIRYEDHGGFAVKRCSTCGRIFTCIHQGFQAPPRANTVDTRQFHFFEHLNGVVKHARVHSKAAT